MTAVGTLEHVHLDVDLDAVVLCEVDDRWSVHGAGGPATHRVTVSCSHPCPGVASRHHTVWLMGLACVGVVLATIARDESFICCWCGHQVYGGGISIVPLAPR